MPPDTDQQPTDPRQTPDGALPAGELVSDAELAQMLEELDRAEGPVLRGKPLEVALVRELSKGDLIDLLPQDEPAEGASGSSLISRIRHSHHQIARLMASGRKLVEISAILGYSPNWLSSLKNDPAFRELLAYYSANQEAIMVEAIERQKNLGLAALEELQERLETDPEAFGNRELMELVETNVNKPRAVAPSGASGPFAPPVVNISFVTPEAKPLPPVGNGLVIEATPEPVDSK